MSKSLLRDPELGITVNIPLRWGDMDAYGHINNVQIVRLMEETRIAVFGTPSGTGDPGREAPPVDLLSSVEDGVLTLISDHTVKYLRQLPYRGMPVLVQLIVTAIKGASVELAYRFYDPHTGELAVTATSTMVFVSAETGLPVRLNDVQKSVLQELSATN